MGSDLQFTVSQVQVEGLSSVKPERIAPVWAGYIGQSINVAQLCRLRDAVAAALLNENILTRVEIPEQQITDGVVRLEVIEAQIESVTVEGDIGKVRSHLEKVLAPLTRMPFIDLDVAQRYLLLATDTPGIVIQPVLMPGTSRGGLILRVRAERSAVSGLASIQNLNSVAQGRAMAFARLDLNSFTALGERTTLIAATSSDFEEQRIFQLIEEIRLNADGLVARASATLGLGSPGGDIAALDLGTRSIVGNLELAYPVMRHRRHNLSLAGGVDLINQRTRVFDSLLLSTERARIAYARISGDVSNSNNQLPASFTGSLELRQGMGVLEASSRGSPLMTRPFANPEAFVVRGAFNGSVSPIPQATLAVAGIAQYSASPLMAYEQFGIGNLTIGRGYDPNSYPADRGVAVSTEIQLTPFQYARRGFLSPFVFTDVARVDTLGPQGGDRTLMSIGGGARFRVLDKLSGSVTYAHPLDTLQPGGPSSPDRLLVSLSTHFR